MSSKTRIDSKLPTLILAVALAFPIGCASSGSESGSSTAASTGSTKPPKGVAPPADHRMAKVQMAMTSNQVLEIMGTPTRQHNYLSGKAFQPFNFGNDSGSRLEYQYKGEGRVIFAVPRWGGEMTVVRVDYDPNEDGM